MARRSKRRSSGKWIQGAVKRPGQLHRDLGVPQGQKIPRSKIQAAARKGGKVGQRARFALNVSGGGSGSSSSSGGNRKRRSHTVKSHKRTLSSGRTVRVKRHRRSKKR